MPILQGIKRVSPIDINKNVKVGVPLPLNEINIFKGTETMKEQVKTNLINLLLTAPGERINLPNYGVGIRKLLFEQKLDLQTIKLNLLKHITRHIPLITLLDVKLSSSNDQHTIFMSITYGFNLDGNIDKIQLNFT